MRSFQFIQELQQDLVAVENGTINPFLFSEPDYGLVNKLREFTFELLRTSALDTSNRYDKFVDDFSSRSIFHNRIRYCVIELRSISIDEEEFFEYVTSAIRYHLQRQEQYDANLKNAVVKQISRCFEIWYRPDDIFRVDFARQRQLIFFDSNRNKWALSNLGHYVQKLSAFEVIVVLCVLEVFLTSQDQKHKFISRKSVEIILTAYESKRPLGRDMLYPYSLRLFGLIEGYPNHATVTDFGYRVISNVKSKFDDISALLMVLIETEIVGVHPVWSKQDVDFLNSVNNSELLSSVQKESVQNALSLAHAGACLDALKIIYPIIEELIAQALEIDEIPIPSKRTLRPKLDKAIKNNLISSQSSMGVEVLVDSRNAILHGKLSSSAPAFLAPLLDFIQAFFLQILVELETNQANKLH